MAKLSIHNFNELSKGQQEAIMNEQQRRERNRQQAISVFAGVLAAAAVIGVIFIGIGALGLLAFFGAGGMLAEADE